jgi:alpha-tubulin N-acetyltransferase 1
MSLESSTQNVIRFSQSVSLIGLLKVGEKHLYVHDSHGQVHERTPLCLLDFYVHESKQRAGYGKRLFDIMLEVISFTHLCLCSLNAW